MEWCREKVYKFMILSTTNMKNMTNSMLFLLSKNDFIVKSLKKSQVRIWLFFPDFSSNDFLDTWFPRTFIAAQL